MKTITLNTTVNDLFVLNLISGRTLKRLVNNGSYDMGDVIRLEQELGSLKTIEGFGAKCQYEIKNVLEMMESSELIDDEVMKTPEQKRIETVKAFRENYNTKITPEKRTLIVKLYKKGFEELSPRARHLIIRNFPTMSHLMETMATVSSNPLFRSKNKSNTEVARFILNFTEQFHAILDGTDKDWAVECMKSRFGFLNTEEAAFVCDYKNENGYLPLLFMVITYLKKSSRRDDLLIREFYGIGCEPKSLDDIANKKSMSRERVRQILGGRRKKDGLENVIEMAGSLDRYHFLKKDFFVNDDEEYNKVRNSELAMHEESTIAGVAMLLGGFFSEIINGKRVYVSKEILSEGKLNNLASTTKSKFNVHRNEDTTFSVHIFMEKKHFGKEKSDSLVKLVLEVFRKCFGAEVAGGMITLQNNRFNYAKAVEEILTKSEAPMTIKEILAEVKQMDGGENAREFDIKYVFMRSSKYVAIGRTGTYTMAARNMYTGTIRSLVEDTMKASDKYGMHIDDITKSVVAVFPNTNKRSIQTSLDNCSARFKALGKGFYALAKAC